jgi:hypothetical protein
MKGSTLSKSQGRNKRNKRNETIKGRSEYIGESMRGMIWEEKRNITVDMRRIK